MLAVSFDEYRDNEQRICECELKSEFLGRGDESVDGIAFNVKVVYNYKIKIVVNLKL